MLQVWLSHGSNNVLFTFLNPIAYSISYVLLMLAGECIFLIPLLVLASHYSQLGKIQHMLYAWITQWQHMWRKVGSVFKIRIYWFPHKQQVVFGVIQAKELASGRFVLSLPLSTLVCFCNVGCNVGCVLQIINIYLK